MPFVSEAYLKYLEDQFQQASGGGGGQGGEDTLPPPATGPGSNPWIYGQSYDPSFQPGPTPSPVVQQPSTVAMAGGGPNEGGIATPGLEPGLGVPTTPPGTPDFPGSNTPAPYDVYPPAEDEQGGGTPPVMSAGQGDRGDDSGQVPGVDLSWRDRANMALRNLGLPPLPTNYSPTGGLPPGFTETNRFGGGAPIFNPPGMTGPNWLPGGSIFGARYVPGMSVPGTLNWTPGAPGGNLGTIGADITWHMAQPHFGGLTLAQVARMHPEWLPGLANMGRAGAGGEDYGAHAGAGVTSAGLHTSAQ